MRLAVVLVGMAAAACAHSTDATGFVFQYGLFALGCGTTCAAPGSAEISTASRGDTVWVRHFFALIGARDSFLPETATLRPDCAGHVIVLRGNTAIQTLPAPTCPDSTFEQDFTLAGVTAPQLDSVDTRWVVDSQLTPGAYVVQGRVMVHPRIEPARSITITP